MIGNGIGFGPVNTYYPSDCASQQAAPLDDRVWREEKAKAEHEQRMASAWNSLCTAERLRADTVLMGDLKRWLALKCAEVEADIKRVGL